MQQEFNKRELGIEDFNVKNGIVTVTDRCCYDLDRLSDETLGILTDKSLVLKFFMEVEKRRLEILEKLQLQTSKSCTNDKVLPKEFLIYKMKAQCFFLNLYSFNS